MKIVHIIIGLNVGGAELMLKRLVLNSQRNGEFQHEIISLTDLGVVGSDLRKQGISVYTLGMTSILKLPTIFLKLKKIIKQIDPNVVQTWMYHADFLGGIAAKQVGIDNIIWGIRTTDVTQGASRLTILLRSLCAKLSYRIPKKIVCAAHVSKELHEKIGYDATKMIVIPNGFELDKLVATDEDRKQLRQELNLLDTTVVIGSVGRFNEVKNQRLFVEIAALLVKEFPDLKFMMVGRDNDKNNQTLIEWLQEYSLEEHFRLLGQRSDIPRCLKAMDIFCLHSKTEGFPNVLGEAMAVGVLPVALDVGESRYLINNKQLIASNENELVLLLKKIICGKMLNDDIRNKNYIRIKDDFSISNIVNMFEDLYREIDDV